MTRKLLACALSASVSFWPGVQALAQTLARSAAPSNAGVAGPTGLALGAPAAGDSPMVELPAGGVLAPEAPALSLEARLPGLSGSAPPAVAPAGDQGQGAIALDIPAARAPEADSVAPPARRVAQPASGETGTSREAGNLQVLEKLDDAAGKGDSLPRQLALAFDGGAGTRAPRDSTVFALHGERLGILRGASLQPAAALVPLALSLPGPAHPALGEGALAVGFSALAAFLAWSLSARLRRSPLGLGALATAGAGGGVLLFLFQPAAALAVVLAGVAVLAFHGLGEGKGPWVLSSAALGGALAWAVKALAAGGAWGLLPAAALGAAVVYGARRLAFAPEAPRWRWAAAALGLALAVLAPSLPPVRVAPRAGVAEAPQTGAQAVASDARFKEHLPFGPPSTGNLLLREGYVLSYDPWLKSPRWVAYHLSAAGLEGSAKRTDDFRADPELKAHQRAELEDYRGSGYQRGHLAPASSMKRDARLMSESFLLSNMAPQASRLNEGVWSVIESRERKWARENGDVYVLAGPAFLDAEGKGYIQFKLIGRHRVAIPTHFWKVIVVRRPEGSLEAVSYLLPNQDRLAGGPERYAATARDIELQTGLDFFPELPDEIQKGLKGR